MFGKSIKGRSVALVTLFVISILTAADIYAKSITINLTAEVLAVEDSTNILEGKIIVGSIITGNYTYDSNTPDSNPSSDVGEYRHYDSPNGIFLTSGGFVFCTDPCNVDFLVGVADTDLGDSYVLSSCHNKNLANGYPIADISWQLDDDSGSAIDSDVLPETPPVLEDWNDTSWNLSIWTPSRDSELIIEAEVTSVELVPFALVYPNGNETLIAGSTDTVTWINDPCTPVANVQLEYSSDDGGSWQQVETVPNTGSYDWTVPNLTSDLCRIRISDPQSGISDQSFETFTIMCVEPIPGDINGDCYVNLKDFAIMSYNWLKCNNLSDPNCSY